MFELPSMWNLILSTAAFLVAAWYLRRYLDEQGVPKGMTRGMLVLVLASVVSWATGEVVDWTQVKLEGPQQTAHNSSDLSQLLKAAGQDQP
jgi:4-amino-4-deoxy-L-arabinose transferase-like glycosyltransferase